MRSPALGPTMPQPIRRLLCLVPQRLGQAFVAAERQRAPARRPRENRLAEFEALGLGLRLGDADPGDFRVGIGDRGDRLGVERGFVAAGDFRRDLALVRRLVGEHRLADDVADGEDVRHVGAHLLVDRDEAALVDRDARRLGADRRAVGPAPDRDQHRVEHFGLRAALALEGDMQPVRLRPRRRSPWSSAGSSRSACRCAWRAARRCRGRRPASTGPSFRSTVIFERRASDRRSPFPAR